MALGGIECISKTCGAFRGKRMQESPQQKPYLALPNEETPLSIAERLASAWEVSTCRYVRCLLHDTPCLVLLLLRLDPHRNPSRKKRTASQRPPTRHCWARHQGRSQANRQRVLLRRPGTEGTSQTAISPLPPPHAPASLETRGWAYCPSAASVFVFLFFVSCERPK